MNGEDLPVVDVALCTACGDCVEVCPLNLFTLEPVSNRVVVQCSTPVTGELARSLCRVACDACGRCALDAPEGVIEMSGGLPRLIEPGQALFHQGEDLIVLQEDDGSSRLSLRVSMDGGVLEICADTPDTDSSRQLAGKARNLIVRSVI